MRVGSDFSGVGSFRQALMRLGVQYETVFACDIDVYARQTYILNYGEPAYFPKDVYDREIPEEPLDIYMTSPPCQAFSLAGGRDGENDNRGLLFYNSHEFIKQNKPRYFIFENVKGLLSDDGGRTFRKWCDMLGGKSVNGTALMFPHEDSLPYHLYYQVLNAKDYGIPQSRERVFLIGIRDDEDNYFRWPKKKRLKLRLKDVLEDDINEKYYLSDSAIKSIILNENNLQQSKIDPEIASTLQTPGNACGTYKGMNAISVRSATKKGYETAIEGDSIQIAQATSNTRRGRVGRGIAKTIETAPTMGIVLNKVTGGGIHPKIQEINYQIRRLTPRESFRLMDFPDTFKWDVSDTQAYKQAGNSICVGVLEQILIKLNIV